MKTRLRASESVALASSIYMVCRKRTEKSTAYFNEIKSQIKARIKEKLDQFWNEGIGGSDFFISAIGPTMEVFGKYESVEKLLEKGKVNSMIDALHAALLYWEQNKRKEISELLEETGNLSSNAFWQVAQAISEVLPEGDKEKQMLQGFLYGKESYGKAEAKVDKYQKTLFEEE
jgi:adenine-specific DNA methylase